MAVAAVLAAIVIGLQVVNSLNPGSGSPDSATSPFGQSAPAPALRAVYEVEGSALSAGLTMSTPTGTQQNTVGLPLRNTAGEAGVGHTARSGEFLYISAQNQAQSGTVTCRITLDGDVVSENSSSGAYGIAQCEYSVT